MNEFTPQYVNEFKCLGSDCSDTCCQGWMINIDKDTHEKYQKVEIDEVDNIGDYLIKKNTPSSRHFSSIKMKKNGFCPFLGKDKLCGLQKKYGEDYLSDTCNRFPRREINFISKKFTTLKMACPEAARLCLSSKDSMNISFNKVKFNGVFKLVSNEYQTPMNRAGELILNKAYELLRNNEISFINSIIIIEKLLDQQYNISMNLKKFDEIYKFFLDTFSKADIVTFDNSNLKISFLIDIFNFLKEMKNFLEENNFKNEKFIKMIDVTYNELVNNFDKIEDAIFNFSKINSEYVVPFEKENEYIFRNFFLNEILGYSNIFTAPLASSRNKLYSTIFTASLCKLILVARCSKEKRALTLNDFIEVVNKVDKSSGIFFQFDKDMELIFNPKVLDSLSKIDPQSTFNSTLFLFA